VGYHNGVGENAGGCHAIDEPDEKIEAFFNSIDHGLPCQLVVKTAASPQLADITEER
jgi:hypothetical protein